MAGRPALHARRQGQRSNNGFISFISLISVAGIALGVAALIIVLSVMNGFQKQVTDRMLSVLAHIEVFDARGDMPQWREPRRKRCAYLAVRPAPGRYSGRWRASAMVLSFFATLYPSWSASRVKPAEALRYE
jgi:ABC-type lipoprotein release transport system permease subunit